MLYLRLYITISIICLLYIRLQKQNQFTIYTPYSKWYFKKVKHQNRCLDMAGYNLTLRNVCKYLFKLFIYVLCRHVDRFKVLHFIYSALSTTLYRNMNLKLCVIIWNINYSKSEGGFGRFRLFIYIYDSILYVHMEWIHKPP